MDSKTYVPFFLMGLLLFIVSISSILSMLFNDYYRKITIGRVVDINTRDYSPFMGGYYIHPAVVFKDNSGKLVKFRATKIIYRLPKDAQYLIGEYEHVCYRESQPSDAYTCNFEEQYGWYIILNLISMGILVIGLKKFSSDYYL